MLDQSLYLLETRKYLMRFGLGLPPTIFSSSWELIIEDLAPAEILKEAFVLFSICCGLVTGVSGSHRCNKELGGTCDLINQYRLWPYYEFFCKRSLPRSISETPYLQNVVGDTKIRKGEGMELDQLCNNTNVGEKKAQFCPLDLDVLSEAFHMREMDPIHLSYIFRVGKLAKKEVPNAMPKSENQPRDHKKKRKVIEKDMFENLELAQNVKVFLALEEEHDDDVNDEEEVHSDKNKDFEILKR
ncbi:hypothetical protein RJT34_03800 [Clitoria ternatea]|uniref:Uncharacterized protein n=1 Tax=Clitoria ternatea TaxID=43366 RepID=A0AAN9KMV8_CLITE